MAVAVAVAAAEGAGPAPPISSTAAHQQPAEPGAGEAAALVGLVSAMGADQQLLASLNETVASEGTLCGWHFQHLGSFSSDILCNNATGAITSV